MRPPARARRVAIARAATAALALTVVATACAPEDGATDPANTAPDVTSTGESTDDSTAESPSETSSSGADCEPGTLQTLEPDILTIATDQPAYEPWMVDDDPTNKQGFEAAVAYAVAEVLGFDDEHVTWVRVPFNTAIQPGPKSFDFDINQFSITNRRKKAVDFSSPYYTASQAVVATGSSPAAGATSLADLAGLTIGAQVATTSLEALSAVVETPEVFNSNDDAKLALENGQVDAIVVDLPTAFFITSAELTDGVIVGQLPASTEGGDEFGLLLDKGSPLTECVTAAVDTLREDGTLDALEAEWLADVAAAPVLE